MNSYPAVVANLKIKVMVPERPQQLERVLEE
jgi:hypothetical protein